MPKSIEVGYRDTNNNEWRYARVLVAWDGTVSLDPAHNVSATVIGSVYRTDPSDKRSWRGQLPNGRWTYHDSRKAALRYVIEAFQPFRMA